jgi:hypothetical protein
MGGVATPSGSLGLKVIRADGSHEDVGPHLRVVRERPVVPWPQGELSLRGIAHLGLPRRGLDERVNAWRTANFRNLQRGVRRVLAARALRLPTFYGTLYLTHIRADGEVLELGLASMRVVTTVGVNYLVDAFQNTTELENLKFHGIGTGAVAEASGDTALGAESTTALLVDNTRATGSTIEGGSANIYRTVGTVTVDAAVANTEHGILSQAATGGGTLWDRSVYGVVNLAIGDSLQATYDATFPAGS